MLCLNLLLAAGTPTRDPVVSDGVEDESRTLLTCGETTLLSEFLPLGLRLFLRSWLRPWSQKLGLWQIHTIEGLSIL